MSTSGVNLVIAVRAVVAFGIMQRIGATLVVITERILTWRIRRKARRRLKQSQKHPILDWIEAFLQAAFLVLVINQYLLQAYQIPSGSMIETLLLEDRIFVNKVVYGPELLPGVAKLPGFARPQQREVVIFENPSYISRGTTFTILQRAIYMLTLSLIDIDRDEMGQPRAQLLIKRAVGVEGDRFRSIRGDIEILPSGTSTWMTEEQFGRLTGADYRSRRMLDADDYLIIEEAAEALALQDLDLPLTERQAEAIGRLRGIGFGDPIELDRIRQSVVYAARPHVSRQRERMQFLRVGWYVPANRIFPLGDNRDNSRDGRYFGPVHVDDVLGRAMVIYWPIPRVGPIR